MSLCVQYFCALLRHTATGMAYALRLLNNSIKNSTNWNWYFEIFRAIKRNKIQIERAAAGWMGTRSAVVMELSWELTLWGFAGTLHAFDVWGCRPVRSGNFEIFAFELNFNSIFKTAAFLFRNCNENVCSAWRFSLASKVAHSSSLENVFQQVTSHFSVLETKNPELIPRQSSTQPESLHVFQQTARSAAKYQFQYFRTTQLSRNHRQPNKIINVRTFIASNVIIWLLMMTPLINLASFFAIAVYFSIKLCRMTNSILKLIGFDSPTGSFSEPPRHSFIYEDCPSVCRSKKFT